MHAEIHQLIALRDDLLVDANVQAHVQTCTLCRHRLEQHEQLQDALRGMPDDAVPQDAWQKLRHARALETGRNVYGNRHVVGVAAALLLGVTVVAMYFATNSFEDTATEGATLAQLQRHSLELEYALRNYRADEMMSLETADVIVTLQDSIALIDFQLENASTDDRRRDLWRERIELMQTLVMVRATEQTFESI